LTTSTEFIGWIKENIEAVSEIKLGTEMRMQKVDLDHFPVSVRIPHKRTSFIHSTRKKKRIRDSASVASTGGAKASGCSISGLSLGLA
jgi:hypothetical protein